MNFRRLLGRRPRAYDARVPQLGALMAERVRAAIPASIDYAHGMAGNLGMMLNDRLSDCTCAAFYHARQVWTFHAGAMERQWSRDVEALYEGACGYRPGEPSTDAGGVEQHVLAYLHRVGAPIDGGVAVDRIRGFVEVPVANIDDVKSTIYNSGVAYIGMNMPAYINPPDGEPPKVWDVEPRHSAIDGGHAVVLTGYDDDGATLISWGARYRMTWAFFRAYVDEAYAIVDDGWIRSPHAREHRLALPGGVSMEALTAAMKGL
jgi:hypothetical protein